ncbi:hypothetical protein HDR58_06845 [bacterium]|nr:hypothetical protein [bacterium]
MREIDKNINSVNFKGIQKPAVEETVIQEPAAAPVESKEIKDLSAMPSAVLGKSQISSDSIESDMKFLEKNPQLAAELNKAIDKYAETHSEEETIQMLEKMHQEFVVKK